MLELFDTYNYVAYPMTIGIMVRELKKIIDDYQKKKITNEEFKTIIFFYYQNSSDKIINDKNPDELNITVIRKLGMHRKDVLVSILKDLNIFH